MRAILLFLALLVSACAPRGDLIVAPNVPAVGQEIEVFVATSRRLIVDRDPQFHRSSSLSYLSRTIAIPPDRQPGSVKTATAPVDPLTAFYATKAEEFPSEAAFRAEVARALQARPKGSRDLVIYIHGFNNRFADGVLRIAQLSADLEIPGVAMHYSWPSAGNPLGYGYDRDSMLFARDGLESLIRTAAAAGAEDVVIAAHSMGALMTMEALRQIAISDVRWPHRNIDTVVLISPDIDIEVFQSQARRIDPLPERFAIFVSNRDRALRLSARLSGQTNRLGNIADAEKLAALDVALLDLTEFSTGAGHFTAASSPAALALIQRLAEVERAFDDDRAGRTGLVSGTLLTLQTATNILSGNQ